MILSGHLGEEEEKHLFKCQVDKQSGRQMCGREPPSGSQAGALPSSAAQQGATQKGAVPADAGWPLRLQGHVPGEAPSPRKPKPSAEEQWVTMLVSAVHPSP